MKIYSASIFFSLLIELATPPLSKNSIEKTSIESIQTSQNLACPVTSILDEQERYKQASEFNVWKKRKKMATYTIPVVVHLFEETPSITDQQVNDAVASLNGTFSNALNLGNGVDTQIEFCLATRAPDGGLTNGINRITSPYEEFDQDIEDAKLKTMIAWDPRHYVNIWTVGFINSELAATYDSRDWWTRGPVGGYATLPGSIIGATNFTDGVAVAGLGTGLWTHEMGHYMGLLHTFEPTNEQDCINNDCERDGDMVCDTPPDATIGDYLACGGSEPNSTCNTDTLSNYSNGFFTTDVDDDFRNFMDYGNGGCQSDFTQGQKERMLFHIDSYRTLLYTQAPSNNLACTLPCTSNVSIDFFTQSDDNPIPGSMVSFISTTSNATNFEWYAELIEPTIGNDYSTAMVIGYTPSTAPIAVTADLTHAFPSQGKYRMYLKAWDADPTCFASYSRIARVGCGVDARFYPNKRLIASKQPQSSFQDTVTFFNRSTGATSYEWTVKHVPYGPPNDPPLPDFISTDTDLEYIFPEPGFFEITLKAINGVCEDSMGPFELEVEDPTIDANLFVFGADCFNEDSIRVSYQVWNRGYDTLNVGMPISFYEEDPRQTNPAPSLLKTIFLPEIIYGSESKNYVEYVKRADLGKIDNVYVVFNDPGTTIFPLTFPPRGENSLSANTILPASGIAELGYANNVHSDQDLQFAISATPITAMVCQGDTYDISIMANGTGGSFTTDWQVNNGASLACSNCLNQTVTVDDQDVTVELEVISEYSCKESITFNLTVLNPKPTINTTPEICQGDPSPNFNTFVTGGGHTWYTSTTAVTVETNPTVDTSSPGNRSLWVTKTISGCEGTRVKFDYTIKNTPQPTITNPADACEGDASPLIADIVSGNGNYKWYNAETGGGEIPQPTFTTTIANDFEYWVTQITTDCESARSPISFNVHSVPAAPDVTSIVRCRGEDSPVVTHFVTATNPTWYNTNDEVIAAPNFLTTEAMEFVYKVTQTSAENCESPKATLRFTVLPPSEMPEISEIEDKCLNEGIFSLSGFVTGTNIVWYDSDNNDAVPIAEPNGETDTMGTVTYWVTQNANTCESQKATLTFTVLPLSEEPTIGIIEDKCVNDELFRLSNFVISATDADVRWYDSDNNNAMAIAEPSGKTDTEGTITYWVTQNTKTCESPKVPISYTVYPIPEMPAVQPIEVCINDDEPNLFDFVIGGNMKWYSAAVLGDGEASNLSLDTDISGNFMYWVTQTIDGCISPRIEIPYNVHQLEVSDDGPYKIDEGQSQKINLIINQTPNNSSINIIWSDESGQDISADSSVTVMPSDPAYYLAEIENSIGCRVEHEVFVNVIHFLYSAQIFSPNGDGLNELWQIRKIEEFPDAKVSVYNRWGKLVFESLNYSNNWNGEVNGNPLPVGTYYFVIDQSDYDRDPLTGSVTIVR